MKTRQFKQIPAVAPARRAELVIEGLRAIGSNVAALADELQKCDEAGAWRSGRLVYNAAREEAGKFLVLLDAWRAPAAKGATLSRQYARAGNHLAKLVYAQIADYSIASRGELVRAVNLHRRSLYLDGPNDHDWIFRSADGARGCAVRRLDRRGGESRMGDAYLHQDAVRALALVAARHEHHVDRPGLTRRVEGALHSLDGIRLREGLPLQRMESSDGDGASSPPRPQP